MPAVYKVCKVVQPLSTHPRSLHPSLRHSLFPGLQVLRRDPCKGADRPDEPPAHGRYGQALYEQEHRRHLRQRAHLHPRHRRPHRGYVRPSVGSRVWSYVGSYVGSLTVLMAVTATTVVGTRRPPLPSHPPHSTHAAPRPAAPRPALRPPRPTPRAHRTGCAGSVARRRAPRR